MASFGGRHRQASSDRVFGYFVQYGPSSEDEAFFVCVISEPGRGLFGTLERNSLYEGSVRVGSDSRPSS